MPSSTSARAFPEAPRHWRTLLAAIAAGPFAWAMQLGANYVMSYVACEQRHSWMLHLCSAVCAAVVAFAALTAWRLTPSGEGEHDVTRFMARSGLALCLFFLLVIVSTEIPVLLIPPCTP